MRRLPRKISQLLFLACLLGLTAIGHDVARADNRVDHHLYGELLQAHVKKGVVDYGGFKKDEVKLDRYEEDFDDNVVGFFMKYAKGDLLKRLGDQHSQVEVEYSDYDWSLNGK